MAWNLNSYAYLPSLITKGSVQSTTPIVTEADKLTSGTEGASFGDFLQEAITNTVGSDAEHKVATNDLVMGEDTDLHTISIASQKAELMLDLTVQIRNKMVESYQEIMRMQI